MTTTTVHRYTFQTWIDGRSNRRDRQYVVESTSFVDAHDEAIRRAQSDTKTYTRTTLAELVDVDAQGPPSDCAHLLVTDCGRLCVECFRPMYAHDGDHPYRQLPLVDGTIWRVDDVTGRRSCWECE